VRLVVDPGVLIAALLTPDGPPAAIVLAVRDEQVELVVSPKLLGELSSVLVREKFRRWVSVDEARDYVEGLARLALTVADPPSGEPITRDPKDDYLVRLAQGTGSYFLVSGDADLLAAASPELGVSLVAPRRFLDILDPDD
jgi:putative PIN family toxin of toxin-antitoxin system